MDSKLKAALWYEKKGYSVIPVKQDKKPFIKWSAYQQIRADAEPIRREAVAALQARLARVRQNTLTLGFRFNYPVPLDQNAIPDGG